MLDHQVRSSEHTSKNICDCAVGGYNFSGINVKLSAMDKFLATKKRMSRNLDVGGMQSGQFCDLTIENWMCCSTCMSMIKVKYWRES